MNALLYRFGCWLKRRYCPHYGTVYKATSRYGTIHECLECRRKLS